MLFPTENISPTFQGPVIAYVTSKLAPNQSGFGELIEYSRLAGTTTASPEGVAQLTFSTQNQHGNKVETVAQLSLDSRYLAGITTEAQGKDTKPLKYAWVALRK